MMCTKSILLLETLIYSKKNSISITKILEKLRLRVTANRLRIYACFPVSESSRGARKVSFKARRSLVGRAPKKGGVCNSMGATFTTEHGITSMPLETSSFHGNNRI
mmetsp:Transcript_24924/g.52239  ORF Transcript_24924/g.52239 Transcript_24924/m.52239 type:complete len:106 (-) Transcript_24924:2760-3077(-)